MRAPPSQHRSGRSETADDIAGLLGEAADEIERLTAERDSSIKLNLDINEEMQRLSRELDALKPSCAIDPSPRQLYDDNCRLRHELAAMTAGRDSAYASLRRLQAGLVEAQLERDALRKASLNDTLRA
jgi:hypothetical protein